MDALKSSGPRSAQLRPHVDPQPAAAPETKAADTTGRSMFEARPQTEHLLRGEGGPNTTWEQMTKSLGEAFDIRKAGRAVDTNLLYELSRNERDPMPQRLAAAELSAMHAIDGKAFEQITNNTNFEGWKMPVEDRLAFALLMNLDSPKLIQKYPMNAGKPTFEVVAQLLGKPVDGEWLGAARTQARELLQAVQSNTLLDSPAYAKALYDQLAARGQLILPELASSSRGLLAQGLAIASGAGPEKAIELGEAAKRGDFDVVTFQALAPSAQRNGKVVFAQQFGKSALAPGVTLDEAAKIAASVARGDLGLGQLHGFMMKFGESDDAPTPMLTLKLATELIIGVNKREISEADLGKALDVKNYFPGELSNRVWDHFFSGTDEHGGKYTVSGIAPASTYTAPFMQLLDAEVVRGLASDEKRAAFASAFQAKMSDALPKGGLGTFWDRVTGGAKNEQQEYAKLTREAFAAGRAAAEI